MNPPRLATWLLRRCGPANDALLGDLLEEYREGRSARWYWRQVVIAMFVGRSRYLPRLIISALAFVVGVLVATTFIEPVVDVVLRALSLDGRVTYADSGGARLLAASVAVLAGFVLATPVIFHQLALASTGSNGDKRWLAVRFAFVATGCFMSGAVFSHFVLFPWIYQFLSGFVTGGGFPSRLWGAYSLYAKLLLMCGLMFQLPATAFLLARVGVITPAFLVRNLGYAVVLMFTVAAVLTPTGDPITLTLTAVPLVAVYGLSVLMARGAARGAGRAVRPG